MTRTTVPEPWALVGVAVLGVSAVLVLPALAGHLPHPGRAEQAKYALTCLGVVALTIAYLYAVARRLSLGREWLLETIGYGAGLAVVKFILSPSAFEHSDASLGRFIATGIVAMLVYIGGLAFLYIVATRSAGQWPWRPKLLLAIVLAGAAVLTRLAAAAVVGTTSTDLRDLFGGPGLLLPVIVVAASLGVMASYEHAGAALPAAFAVGVALVVVQHAWWVIYMQRLFG